MTTTFKPSQPKTARYWLDICRQHGRTSYLKVAGIAGQGSDEDTPFEQAIEETFNHPKYSKQSGPCHIA